VIFWVPRITIGAAIHGLIAKEKGFGVHVGHLDQRWRPAGDALANQALTEVTSGRTFGLEHGCTIRFAVDGVTCLAGVLRGATIDHLGFCNNCVFNGRWLATRDRLAFTDACKGCTGEALNGEIFHAGIVAIQTETRHAEVLVHILVDQLDAVELLGVGDLRRLSAYHATANLLAIILYSHLETLVAVAGVIVDEVFAITSLSTLHGATIIDITADELLLNHGHDEARLAVTGVVHVVINANTKGTTRVADAIVDGKTCLQSGELASLKTLHCASLGTIKICAVKGETIVARVLKDALEDSLVEIGFVIKLAMRKVWNCRTAHWLAFRQSCE
jgi:hypothetical protein